MNCEPAHHTPSVDFQSGTAAPGGAFLPVGEEALVFWRLRRRLMQTVLRQTFSRARFRLSLVLVLSLVLWLGLFLLFAEGFQFLKTAMPQTETYDQTVRAVFAMFFAALMVMLVFSAGVILYGLLFRSPEVAFLLTSPARTERVFLHKFQEAVLLSGWGFLLLGSPMLLAYGFVAGAAWYYYAMLVPFLLAFVYVPCAVGAILCLAIIYQIPGNRVHILAVGGVLLAGAMLWVVWSLLTGPEQDLLTPGWFQEILGRLQFSEGRLLPNWWLSSGLLEAGRGVWSESVLFLAVMISNALLGRQAAIWLAGRIYRPAYSALYGRTSWRKRTRPACGELSRAAWIDRALFWATGCLPLPMRLLMVKDLRWFRRDPVQWSQFLIFFGLLALYFINIRRFSYSVYHVGWVNMVSFLNLSVVGLLMSTFTTRFIFPMISLECRRFWLLGLLPLRRETILWSKFLFAAAGSLLPCCGLILLSDGMLRVSPLVLFCHQLTCLVLCVGLSGIAVGLGARFPNLREQSPARIAAGFGGTLNLVLSTLYILAVVLLTALPCHFYLAAARGPGGGLGEATSVQWWLRLSLVIGIAGSLLLGVLATLIPLRIGFRAFRRLEF